MDTRPDRRLTATARLIELLAELLPKLRHHVDIELNLCDSIPNHTGGAGTPTTAARTRPLSGHCTANTPDRTNPDELVDCGQQRPCPDHDHPVELTATERAAEARLHLRNRLASIEADASVIADTAHRLLREGNSLLAHRTPRDTASPPQQCRDGQLGKDGTIEWGDATCLDTATKSSLCGKHYMAWYRWRKANGIDTSKMFEAAAATGRTQG